MRNIFLISAFLLFSFTVNGQHSGTESIIEQLGNSNEAIISQEGLDQFASIIQSGDLNYAEQDQFGTKEFAVSLQNGNENYSLQTQTGIGGSSSLPGENIAIITQIGKENKASQHQEAVGNEIFLLQKGNQNNSFQEQFAPYFLTNYISAVQFGNGNSNNQVQHIGVWNVSKVFQWGDFNKATQQLGDVHGEFQPLSQEGTALILQLGTYNEAFQEQWIEGNSSVIEQSGNDNYSYQLLIGYNNEAYATQTGTGNIAQQNQGKKESIYDLSFFNFGELIQTGDGNHSYQLQLGEGNTAISVQSGNNNKSTQIQTGQPGVSIYPSAEGNTSRIYQNGSNNSASVIQSVSH